MDPFTISTGIVGIFSLAIELTKILTTYIGDTLSASKDAQILLDEINLLSTALKQLDVFLKIDAAKVHLKEASALQSVVTSCETKVQDFIRRLKGRRSANQGPNLIERINGHLKKDECQQTVLILQRFTQTFEFSLVVSNWLVMFIIEDFVMY
jgi:hypothetical protein